MNPFCIWKSFFCGCCNLVRFRVKQKPSAPQNLIDEVLWLDTALFVKKYSIARPMNMDIILEKLAWIKNVTSMLFFL